MSASGKSFTFKSIDYGGASYNVYARARQLPRMPRPRVTNDRLAQHDGSVTQGSTFDDSIIRLDCAITGSSTAAVETLVGNTLAQLAKTQEGTGELILDSHSTVGYTARLISGMDGTLGLNGEQFTLEFLCPDPWPHALTATSTGDNAVNVGSVTTI